MQIKEVKVYNFGKIEKREFTFTPGINIIYGENEAGKSTLCTFLTAMLFGMEKGRGRTAKDDYSRYEPWHAPAYYSGAMRFLVGGRPFYLERNFYHKEKREILRNEADGEEMSVAYGDLAMLLGGIDKETFGNTYYIPQTGAVTGRELAAMLAEYLTDAAGSGDRTIHVARAQEILGAKKKLLGIELKTLQEEKQQRKKLLLVEKELLERDCVSLRENVEKVRGQIAQLKESVSGINMPEITGNRDIREQIEEQQRRSEDGLQDGRMSEAGRQRRSLILGCLAALLLALGMLLNWNGTGGTFHSSFWMLQGLLGAGLLGAMVCVGKALGALYRQKTVDEDMENGEPENMEDEEPEDIENEEAECMEDEESEYMESGEAVGMDSGRYPHMDAAEMGDTESHLALQLQQRNMEQMFGMMRGNLDEKETRLYNMSEELAALEQPDRREYELLQDIKALELAAEEIGRIAREFCEDIEDLLNEEVSRYVSAITNGKYDSVRVDEKGNLRVLTEGKEIPPDALSRGTLEQFYLALRLAVGNIVTREEDMPIFLDETFVMYDERRLAQVLKVLAGTGKQILLFTCQKREMELLEKMGIAYHRVLL